MEGTGLRFLDHDPDHPDPPVEDPAPKSPSVDEPGHAPRVRDPDRRGAPAPAREPETPRGGSGEHVAEGGLETAHG
jgi:hypothetical protein